jgi:transposase-like protein
MSKSKAPTTPPAAEIDADADSPQRWTAKRKAALVIDILQGKTTTAEAARQHALTLAEVEQWRDDFITQGTEALRSHPRDLAQQFEAREKTLLAKVGELILHVDILKKAHRHQGKDLPEGICQH